MSDNETVKVKAIWSGGWPDGWGLRFVDMETGKTLPVSSSDMTITYTGVTGPVVADVTLLIEEIETEVLVNEVKNGSTNT